MANRADSTVAETPMIQLRDVTLDYGGDEVVSHVDLSVRRGETKVILGPSGVGKSTILKAILGILKPRTGEVYIRGRAISRLPEKELVKIRLDMAMVFQGGALFDSMTVGENVSYRLREHGMGNEEEIETRVQRVLAFVDLQGAASLRPAQLSGGMRKRVAIARALASNPDIFLFDEPTVGLDPINSYNVEQLISKLKTVHSRSMVIVTHDVASATRLADQIVMLRQGKFIFEGTPNELRLADDPEIQSFLDPAKMSVPDRED